MVSKIKLTGKYETSSVYEEVNQLIKEYFSILSKGESREIDGKKYTGITHRQDDYLDILDIIPNLLEQKTNINSILEHRKCALTEFSIKGAMKGLEEYKDDPELYKKFLENLNNYFPSDSHEFTFIIPINLIFKLDNHQNELNKMLKLFSIEQLNPEDLEGIVEFHIETSEVSKDDPFVIDNDDLEKASKLLQKFPLLLKIDIKARMMEHAYVKAINRVKSFLGYTILIDKIWDKMEYYGDFKEYNITNLFYDPFLIIMNKIIIWPIVSLENKVTNKLKTKNEVIKKETFSFMIKTCDEYIQEIESDSLKNLLFRSFSLYYSAGLDRTLEYSFLKFWNISEYLIKANNSKTDTELLEIMKQFVNDYLAMRVDFIYDKRNDLVHKGITEKISSSDRNLSKLIADLLLNDAILHMKDLRNKREYENHVANIR